MDQWQDGSFHLGINMSGAVSAGAYTAGALDFLMEAIEQWYQAKAAPNPAVPLHDLSIDVFSGASAGGMCAAIAAAMVQGSFDHIQDTTATGTNNRFYEAWVNTVDIEPLLGDRDLSGNKPVVSLLDSTIIDEIAASALAPVPAVERPYISKSLTLFLALTNVRGTPYSLNGNAPGSAEEDIAYYADRLQFETVKGAAPTVSPAAKPLPLGTNAGAWPLLREAAKATGAFPVFLAPRVLERSVKDYLTSPWSPISDLTPEPVEPHWPLKPGDTVPTLNVDGGMTNNDPFQLAHDFLAIRNPLAKPDPKTGLPSNPREADEANAAVLTVAPFPADAVYAALKPNQVVGVLDILPSLIHTLIGQSRFFGESLTAVIGGASSSRFVLAPSDHKNPNANALQCAVLGAFGGFFERGFRAHDYQLGRRNCQRFLCKHFRLAINNPIIDGGLQKLSPAAREAAIQQFDPKETGTMPIIPLVGTAGPKLMRPDPAKISESRIDDIVNWAVKRAHAVAKPLLESWPAREAVDLLISTWGKDKIRDLLMQELKDVVE